jgi:glycosyltransferase involved in cell wall biosynthesis
MVKQKKSAEYSLIVSVCDMADHIERLHEDAVAAMSSLGGAFEILFVDDASADGTSERLIQLAPKDDRVRVLRMRSRFGEAAALDAGIRHSSGERIAFLSSRVNVNIRQIPNLFRRLDEGVDFVIGRRHPRRDALLNRGVSGLFNGMVNRLCKLRLKDVNSGVFATRRSVLERIAVYGDLNHFLPVLAAQQGYKIAEADIEQLAGRFRVSRYPNEYIRRFLDIVTVFFLTRYSKKPIHFMGFLGTICFLVGLVIEVYLFIYRILQMGPIAGRPLLILGALLLVIGIQMISIGLLGEMIIFTHAGEIEEYNIEAIIEGGVEKKA